MTATLKLIQRNTTYNDNGTETETVETTEGFRSEVALMDFVFEQTGYNEVGVDTNIMEKRYGDGIFITGSTGIKFTVEGIDFQTLRSYLDLLAADKQVTS